MEMAVVSFLFVWFNLTESVLIGTPLTGGQSQLAGWNQSMNGLL